MHKSSFFSLVFATTSALVFAGVFASGCGSSDSETDSLTTPGTTPTGGAGGSSGQAGASSGGGGGSSAGTGGANGGAGGQAGGAGGSAGAATGGAAGQAGGAAGASGGAAGATGGAAGATGGAAGATGGAAGAGPGCSDPIDEPNNTKDSATSVSDTECGSGHSYKGIMGLGTDTDWLSFSYKEKMLCTHKAKVSADLDIARVCMFIKCDKGKTNIKSCGDGSEEQVDGLDGCCGTAEEVKVDFSCDGGMLTTDDAKVYIRVDQPGHNECKAYNVEWSF